MLDPRVLALAALTSPLLFHAGASAATADVNVVVKTHHRHAVVVEAAGGGKHHHVYYTGEHAYVAKDGGATIVHAYPGVDVFVGSGGNVSVNVGY